MEIKNYAWKKLNTFLSKKLKHLYQILELFNKIELTDCILCTTNTIY